MRPFPVLFALACAYLCSAQPPVIGSCPIQPANNVWNTPVDNLPVSPNSAAYVNSIGPAATAHADFGSGTWDGALIGIPWVQVDGSQTKYPATFTYAYESDPGPYAIPLNAPIQGGSASTGDRHVIAVDAANCVLYELYAAYPQTSSWQAGSGAIYDLRSNVLRPAGWTSANAAGVPEFPGLVRYEEVAAGAINHAVSFTAPSTQRAYIWPARHYASSLTDTKYPPMGQRFRLKADFDISPFPNDVQVILRALKKYGMILTDNGAPWFISGTPDARWNNDDLATLRNIPGSAFEAVDESSLMVDINSGEAKQPGVQAAVTVSPAAVALSAGARQQFTATVANSSSQSVTWTVNGMAGGNAVHGFIDSTGLYVAPLTVPSPAIVTVTATTVAAPTATGSASVTIRDPAPAILAVTPNPLPAGSFTIRVNGAGFQAGAVARLAGVPLATSFLSPYELTATGSTSVAGSAVPVTVLNPDGQASKSYNIVVSGAEVSVAISPAAATVRAGHSVRFRAAVQGSSNTAVSWQVNGVSGGNSTIGWISSRGVYSAPHMVPSPATLSIRAVSAADPSKSATASVTVAPR